MKQYRYPGTKPFTTEQAHLFFGRKQDGEDLLRLIRNEQLVVLYGKSGLGKSSILNAAVVPDMRREGSFTVLPVRFGAWTEGKTDTPANLAKQTIAKGFADESLLDELVPYDNSLWYFTKNRQLNGGGDRLLLLFDQFEELFSYPEAAISEFKRELTELLKVDVPQRFRQALEKNAPANGSHEQLLRPLEVKIVLAIRSDRMHLLDRLKDYLPNVLRHCFELKALLPDDARDAILLPARFDFGVGISDFGVAIPKSEIPNPQFATPPFDYTPAALEKLLTFLKDPQDGRIEGILLQMLCEHYEVKLVEEKGLRRLDTSDIGDPEQVVKKYYEEKIAGLPEPKRLPSKQLIEDGLVSEGTEGLAGETKGMRLNLHENYIKEKFGVDKPLLERLVDSRLLRSEPFLRGGYTFELSHDRLVPAVLAARGLRREEEARLEAARLEQERQRKLEEAQRQAEQERQLRELAEQAKMEAEAQRQQAISAQEDAEKQRGIAQQNETKAKAGEQRARQRTRIAAAVSLLALLLAMFAGYSNWQAGIARSEADKSAGLAKTEAQNAKDALSQVEKEKVATEEQRKKAEESFKLAEVKTKEAEDNLRKAKTEEQKAKDALAQVEKEKAATEEQRKKAEDSYKLAQEKTKEAEAQRNEAAAERDKAQAALDNLEKANTDVVRLILENADRDILKLDYEAALQKIKAAASLGALKLEVANAYLEIAFWHGEAGNLNRAKNILDSAAMLVNKTATLKQPFRESIKSFDPDVYKKLMERYYPVMVKVEGGTFNMGCDSTIDINCQDDETLHKQEVSSFQMAKHETTWWQYFLFCKATGHEHESPGWGTDGDNPAVNVNWEDAVAYSNWVSRQLGKKEAIGKDSDGRDTINLRSGYRLPTEAEWEYAAKGGPNQSPFVYSGHDEIDSVAWIYSNSGSRTHPVGKKKANTLGLHDMSGNVWEWCWDWRDEYLERPEKDYSGPESGTRRVVRGGSWDYDADYCRTALRGLNYPDSRRNLIGFRLVLVP